MPAFWKSQAREEEEGLQAEVGRSNLPRENAIPRNDTAEEKLHSKEGLRRDFKDADMQRSPGDPSPVPYLQEHRLHRSTVIANLRRFASIFRLGVKLLRLVLLVSLFAFPTFVVLRFPPASKLRCPARPVSRVLFAVESLTQVME